jgi:hypothetical protein
MLSTATMKANNGDGKRVSSPAAYPLLSIFDEPGKCFAALSIMKDALLVFFTK